MVQVPNVVPNGPADVGGVRVGDVIVSVARQSMASPSDVVTAINRHGVGSPLSFGVKRGPRRFELLINPVEASSMKGL